MRTQISITPTRALTYYKAQGLTLERVLVRIQSERDGRKHKYRHKFGLLYTAFSRVKDFEHLRITEHTRELRPRDSVHQDVYFPFAAAWNRIRVKLNHRDRADKGCDQMRRFQREKRELDKVEIDCRKQWQKRWRELYAKYYMSYVT